MYNVSSPRLDTHVDYTILLGTGIGIGHGSGHIAHAVDIHLLRHTPTIGAQFYIYWTSRWGIQLLTVRKFYRNYK